MNDNDKDSSFTRAAAAESAAVVAPAERAAQAHTPEPWNYQEESDAYTHILRAAGGLYVVGFSQHASGRAEADARRVVACVNACAGMADPAQDIGELRAMAELGRRLFELDAGLRADKQALSAALRRQAEWITHHPHGDNCYVSAHYDGDPGNQCNCGKESALARIGEILEQHGAAPA